MSAKILRTWPMEPPPIEHGWRLPISAAACKPADKRHYMPLIAETDALYPALCGRLFNPGFATENGKMGMCFRCERRMRA